jgi:Glu-tRNA(Gln) amidotransferase subunit E-like FAD-binding protein
LFEEKKQKINTYNVFDDSSCLIECDEEPPKKMSEEAFETVALVCKLLNASVVDEVHVMRKTVIDGSAVSGFQRTAIVGLNGKIETSEGEILIPTICLEEESSGIEGDHFNLDRLGIPLIEIATDSESIKNPVQAMNAALKIGELLRSTEKVQRGIGTIRQDLNVSIPEGARVEIKGVQELKSIPKIIENEVERQEGLLKLKGKKIDFEEKQGRIIIKNLSDEAKKEFEGYCRVLKAELRENEVKGSKEVLDFLKWRLDYFSKGVPEETRKAEGVESSYMRPLPGGSRMYPETDCLPLSSKDFVEKVKGVEVTTLDQRIAEYENIGLNKELARKIARGNYKLFDRIAKEGVDAVFTASVLSETVKNLERKGLKLGEERLKEFFEVYKKAVFSRNAGERILELASQSAESIENIVKENNLEKFSTEKLKEIASKTSFEEAIRKYRLNVDGKELKSLYKGV